MDIITISHLNKQYGAKIVLKDFSLELDDHKITSIIGPSGCGKSTLLNIIAGLVPKDSGEIHFDKDYALSYIFQEPRVLAWKTIYENLDFVLIEKIKDKNERKDIITKNLKLVNLYSEANHYPNQLSGGMLQRLSIARAFSFPSDLILMDEPFKSLDLEIKYSLIDTFSQMQTQYRKTVLFVTHDIQEAIILGDEINILSKSPAQVIKKIINPVIITERTIHHNSFFEMEKLIYSILLK